MYCRVIFLEKFGKIFHLNFEVFLWAGKNTHLNGPPKKKKQFAARPFEWSTPKQKKIAARPLTPLCGHP
jgi:hypothetical protein